MHNSIIHEKAVFVLTFQSLSYILSLLSPVLLNVVFVFTADLAVTCATDFHEKRYEHLDKYAFASFYSK